MEIYTLEHLYDFLRKIHGDSFTEHAQKLIDEYVARETQAMQNNIDILTAGLENAELIIEKQEKWRKDFDKAIKLTNKIYVESWNPNYSVEAK